MCQVQAKSGGIDHSLSKTLSLFDAYSTLVRQSVETASPQQATVQMKRLSIQYRRIRAAIQSDAISDQEADALKKRLLEYNRIRTHVERLTPTG